MFSLDELALLAFRDEIKLAAPNWGRVLGGVGSGTGVGAALGAIGGAGVGAVRGYRTARDGGEGALGSIAGGMGGALGGVAGGALLGAGVGAAGGAAVGHLRPNAISSLAHGDTPVLSAASRFGQRQLHGITGWTPEGGLESIRGGMTEARGRLATAKDALSGASTPKMVASAKKELALAERGHAAAQKAHDMGLTSLPGIAKSMKNNGVGNTIKADIGNQWHGAGLGTKALLVGAPALGAASAVAGAESPTGSGKAESVGEHMGQLAGGVMGSAVPIVGQSLIGMPLGFAGKMVGRGIDRLRGRTPVDGGVQ